MKKTQKHARRVTKIITNYTTLRIQTEEHPVKSVQFDRDFSISSPPLLSLFRARRRIFAVRFVCLFCKRDAYNTYMYASSEEEVGSVCCGLDKTKREGKVFTDGLLAIYR